MPKDYLAGLDPSKNEQALRVRLSDQGADFSICVAFSGSELAAFYVLAKPRYSTSSEVIELWALNVHPDYWRLGLGSKLIKSAISSARNYEYKFIELWCIEGNHAAENAYIKSGFHKTCKRRTTSNLTGYPITECLFSKQL